jgi:DNA-binding NtrC family response regulator
VKPARSVLVVDDDRELLRALERTLKNAGYEVRAVECGEDAMSSLADGLPDVVLSDFLLPGWTASSCSRNSSPPLPRPRSCS